MVLKSLYQPFYFMADCLFPSGDLWFRAKTMYLSKNWKTARQVSNGKHKRGIGLRNPSLHLWIIHHLTTFNWVNKTIKAVFVLHCTAHTSLAACSTSSWPFPPQFNFGTQYSTWRTFLFCDFSRKWLRMPWGFVSWFYWWPFSWCWMLTQPWLEARKQFNLAWPCNHIMELTLSSGMYGSALHLLTKN